MASMSFHLTLVKICSYKSSLILYSFLLIPVLLVYGLQSLQNLNPQLAIGVCSFDSPMHKTADVANASAILTQVFASI